MPSNNPQRNSQIRNRTREPQKYNVVMHNDDVTTMEFAVDVLRKVFYKNAEDATMLMLDVHHKGQAVVGTYSLDIAASKVNKALLMAKEQGFPFRMTIEPAETDDLPF